MVQLSDGVTLELSNRGCGVKGASYDPTTTRIESPFVALINRDLAINADPRMANYRPGGQMVHFGNFDDPRKAAYAAAEFFQKPRLTKQRLDLWFSLETPSYKNGALGEWKFPADLSTNKELAAAIQPIMQKWQQDQAEQGAHARTYSNVAYASWAELLKTLDIKGSQVVSALNTMGANKGEQKANIEAVAKASKMNTQDTIDYLKQLGLDLDNPQHIQQIKQAKPLAESDSDLSRIKYLIKY